MYTTVLLTFLVSSTLATDFYSVSCPSASSQNLLKLVRGISTNLFHLGTELQKVCANFPNISPVEIIGDDCYKLQYYLPGFFGNFDVMIKHRLIYVVGHDPMTNVCDHTYGDIRILPDFVNAHRAVWNFENSQLTISIPYKYPINDEINKYCSRDIDDTLIHVSKSLYNNPTNEYLYNY